MLKKCGGLMSRQIARSMGVIRTCSSSSSSRYYEPYELSLAQRAFLVPFFGVRALLDPERGDLVAGFGDAVTTKPVLKKLHKHMLTTESGRQLMQNKPQLTEDTLDLEHLRSLPEGTLGKEYVKFMDIHGYSPDERAEVRFMLDPELAYVMARYRQVHDFWHVLCGLPPTVLGEVGLKWFEFAATGLPSTGLSGLLGPLQLDAQDRRTLYASYVPWAMRAGKQAGAGILAYEYEAPHNLEKTVQQVREELMVTKFQGK